jgi:hypothetical protein
MVVELERRGVVVVAVGVGGLVAVEVGGGLRVVPVVNPLFLAIDA